MDISTLLPRLIVPLTFTSVFLLVFSFGRGNQRSEKLARQLGRFTSGKASASSVLAPGGLFRQRRRLSRFGTLDRLLEEKGFAAGLDKRSRARIFRCGSASTCSSVGCARWVSRLRRQ